MNLHSPWSRRAEQELTDQIRVGPRTNDALIWDVRKRIKEDYPFTDIVLRIEFLADVDCQNRFASFSLYFCICFFRRALFFGRTIVDRCSSLVSKQPKCKDRLSGILGLLVSKSSISPSLFSYQAKIYYALFSIYQYSAQQSLIASMFT